jgi:bacteriocin-like protein
MEHVHELTEEELDAVVGGRVAISISAGLTAAGTGVTAEITAQDNSTPSSASGTINLSLSSTSAVAI